MFHRERDASKVALMALVDHLGDGALVDVQWRRRTWRRSGSWSGGGRRTSPRCLTSSTPRPVVSEVHGAGGPLGRGLLKPWETDP